MNNNIWIIVGTYKTRSEDEGWYISDNAFQRLLWDNMPFKTQQKTEYLETKKYGRLKDCHNVLFFDFAKFDNSLKSTSDEDVLSKKYNDLVNGVATLNSIVESLIKDKCNVRIGFVGHNAYGLFYNALKKSLPKETPTNWKAIKRKEPYGEVLNGIQNNVNFYLLENITSRYYKTRDSDLNGWKIFWEN